MNNTFIIILLLIFLPNLYNSNNEDIFIQLLSQLTINDKYKDSIFGLQLPANNPCEDSFFIQKIKIFNKNGLFFSIFDGHRGQFLSKYANLLLYPYFLENFNINKFIQNFDDRIKISLEQAYDRIELDFLKISFNEHLKKNHIYTRIGSCAISAIIINGKIFLANLGDSKARIFYTTKKEDFGNNTNYHVKKISKTYNMRKYREKRKMKKKFKGEKHLYKCYGPKACYVKGVLQPTRSLGDFTLKYLYFNINNFKIYNENTMSYERLQKFYDFYGPYISSKPNIKIYDLKDNYQYLIMGSDGLWDVFRSRNIAREITDLLSQKGDIIFKTFSKTEKLGYHLMNKALINYSKEINLNGNIKDILEIPFGRSRRNLHDDITIIVCDLSKLEDL